MSRTRWSLQPLPPKLSRWLQIAEVSALVLTLLGFLFFWLNGQVALLLAAMVLALLLNLWNRYNSDLRTRQRSLGELKRLRQDLFTELDALNQDIQRQSAGGLSYLQSSQDLELAMAQLRLQNVRLGASLQTAVQALNQLLPNPVDLVPEPPGSAPEPSVQSLGDRPPSGGQPDRFPSDRLPTPTPPVPSASAPEPSLPSLDPPSVSADFFNPGDIGANLPQPLPQSSPFPEPWQEALSWQPGISFAAHAGWVNAIALSPDGTHLATGGTDQQVRLWDIQSGDLVGEYATLSPISALAFSPDGTYLASGNYDHRIQIWRIADQSLVKTLKGHDGSVKSLVFSADPQHHDRCLISGSYDQTLRIWDISSGSADVLEGHTGSIQTLAWAGAQRCLISGGEEGQLRLWQLPDGQLLDTLAQGRSAVETLALSPDGSILASGTTNGSLYVWHLPSRTLRYTLDGHTGPIAALAITVDGQTLISGGADGRLKLWQLATGQPQGNVADPIEAILDLVLSPSGNLIISSHPGGQVQCWWRQEQQ
ncbi:hypothetical protein [Prochlorothrix hollandica]|uniref:hypothetical protein n=1 Tax=Prochlorothrix hollandica TaxID=1223 RepID=UPI00333F2CF7